MFARIPNSTKLCYCLVFICVLYIEWTLHERVSSVEYASSATAIETQKSEYERLVAELMQQHQTQINDLKKSIDDLQNKIVGYEQNASLGLLKTPKAESAIQETSDLELLPLMLGPRAQPVSRKKSLIVMGIGKGTESIVDDFVKRFGLVDFQYLFFMYDNDFEIWKTYPWFEKTIRVAVTKQMKWWYFKRFLHPSIVEVYEYIFLADSDADYSQIHAKTMLATLREFDIKVAQPSHCNKSHSDWSHPSQDPSYLRETHENLKKSPLYPIFHDTLPKGQRKTPYEENEAHNAMKTLFQNSESEFMDARIGRWTDFVECGPLTIFSRDAWNCFWKYIQNDGATGWGYDFYFETLCAPRHAALLDNQCLYHLHTHSASSNKVYKRRKKNEWLTVMKRFGDTYKSKMMFYGPITIGNSSSWKAEIMQNKKPTPLI